MAKKILLIIFTGVFSGISNQYFCSYTAWIAYSILFWVLFNFENKLTQYFTIGLTIGCIQGLIILAWIPDLITRYTGEFGIYNIVVPFVLILLYSLRIGIFVFLFGFFKIKVLRTSSLSWLVFSVRFSSAAVIIDYLYSLVFKDFPWLLHFIGYTQSTNLYFSQLAELGGVWILTFGVIIINLGFAISIYAFKFKYLISTILLIAIIHIYGFFRVNAFNDKTHSKINVAIIADNTPPETRWSELKLNDYVNKLFALNLKAIKSNPSLIVWNEGSIPWSFRKDDDFLKIILEQSKSTSTKHLMSYFSVSTQDSTKSFNSAYLIKHDGQVIDRYDKSYLLAGLEKPLFGLSCLRLPFFNSNVISGTVRGKNIKPLKDEDFGKIGIVICNESLMDNLTASIAREEISFFIVPSNNSWFSNTQLIYQHLHITRIRAIETRKDFIVNSNLGFSGIIKASGSIHNIHSPNKANVIVTSVTMNPTKSNYYYRRYTFLIILLLNSLLLTFNLNRL